MASVPPAPAENPDRLRAAEHVRLAAEAVLLFLIAFSPWPFASVDFRWRFVLSVGLAVLTALWLAHAVLTRRLSYRADAVSAGLLGLVLLSAFQTVALPEAVVRVLSPATVEWYHAFRPAVDERLPGEADAAPRPATLTLSVDPARTRDATVGYAALFVLYAVGRNFVATRGAVRRLAWVGFANGALLALVALMQFFSSPRNVVLWTFPTEGQVFGPFVCKNHFPYYASLCVGLGIALLVEGWDREARENHYSPGGRGVLAAVRAALERVQSPRSVFLLGGIGLTVAAVPFSLSRGGVLALVGAGGLTAVVARLGGRRRASDDGDGRPPPSGVGVLAAVFVVGVLAAGAWFGWTPVEKRFDTVWQGQAVGDRLPIWRDLWPTAVRFPLFGTGAGTTPHIEAMTRARPEIRWFIYEHAHNDYLEAFIEGGVVRLGLTLLIVGGALWTAARGYVRHRPRTAAPFLLGGFFGLADVALHSIGDFGLAIPANALFATVVAAFVARTADALRDADAKPPAAPDASRPATRKRVKVRVRVGDRPAAGGRREWADEPTVAGWAAVGATGFAAAAGLFLAVEGWRARAVERWRLAGQYAASDFTDPARMDRAAYSIEGALRLRPDDASLWSDFAAARLAAALDKAGRPLAAVAGTGLVAVLPPDRPPADVVASDVVPALRAARTARDLCGVMPGPHVRLGGFAWAFAAAEPAAVHFARAQKTAPYHSEIWYLSGVDALSRGDLATAWADWRVSLTRGREHLVPIVRAAGRHLSADMLRANVLPDDPYTWVIAANVLYPPDDPSARDARRSLLSAAVARWAAGPDPTTDLAWEAWVGTQHELGDGAGAIETARRAARDRPKSIGLRNTLATLLEADERYDEAVPELEWLAEHWPAGYGVRDRLDAARHAIELRREIGGN